jgi:hypothetical protein
MKPFKMAAMAVVAGAGFALVSAPAFAATDCGPSANCTATTTAEISAGSSEKTSDTTLLGAHTEGNGTTGANTSAVNDGNTITLGDTSGTDSTFEATQFGLIHSSTWEGSRGSTESSSGGSGESLAAVFVFGQNIVVDGHAELVDESGAAKAAKIDGSFGTVALNGVATVNVSDGVGNQQANLFATLAELNGSSTGPNSGSNAINVTDAQNIALTDHAEVSNEPYVHTTTFANCEGATGDADDCTASQNPPPSDLASITGSFTNVAGAVAVNVTTGVANQQVNSIVIAH